MHICHAQGDARRAIRGFIFLAQDDARRARRGCGSVILRLPELTLPVGYWAHSRCHGRAAAHRALVLVSEPTACLAAGATCVVATFKSVLNV